MAELLLGAAICLLFIVLVVLRAKTNKRQLRETFGIEDDDEQEARQKKVNVALQASAAQIRELELALNKAYVRRYYNHIPMWSERVIAAKTSFREARKLALRNGFEVLVDYKNY